MDFITREMVRGCKGAQIRCQCSGFGCGVVFRLTPAPSGWSETVLHSFMGLGKLPEAPVIFDSAGNLYGTASEGNGNNGLVFELRP